MQQQEGLICRDGQHVCCGLDERLHARQPGQAGGRSRGAEGSSGSGEQRGRKLGVREWGASERSGVLADEPALTDPAA